MEAIRFGTDGWRARLDVFTTDRVRRVGRAVAAHLDDAGFAGEPVAVGYDARESSPGFANDLADVLTDAGHDVVLPERDCPTPLTAWAVVDRGLAGALVVTASHNPPEYNGVKFIPADGAPAPEEVTDSIEAYLATAETSAARSGARRRADFVGPHADHVLDLTGADLSGVTVVYDAMHGSGRGITDALLERAGAEVERLRCSREPDFGGVAPEPTEATLEGLVDAVAAGADLGVANDGDADRLAVVTPDRGFLDENLFFAALYDYLLESATGPAVRTVSTTFLIDRVAEAHGESVVEVPVGFKWVAAAMAEHDALVGGEESGGFSISGHVREKDGVLAAMLAAAMAAERPLDKRVDDLLAVHGEIHQDKTSIDCPDEEKERVLRAFAASPPTSLAGEAVDRVNDVDGVKALLADGSWLLVRPSGTEPKLRLYAEAGSTDRVTLLLEAGRELVEPLV